jgi:hypothetical protein
VKHPGHNIDLNAAPDWLAHDHIIFDRFAHNDGDRRVEPQDHRGLPRAQAEISDLAQIRICSR